MTTLVGSIKSQRGESGCVPGDGMAPEGKSAPDHVGEYVAGDVLDLGVGELSLYRCVVLPVATSAGRDMALHGAGLRKRSHAWDVRERRLAQ